MVIKEREKRAWILVFILGIGAIASTAVGFWSLSGGELYPDNSSWNVNITGNITAQNVWLPVYAFVHSNLTTDLLLTETWYNLTYNHCEMCNNVNITLNDNNTITIEQAGIYQIGWTIIITDTTVAPVANVITILTKNGVSIDGSLMQKDTQKKDANEELRNNVMFSANVGDIIRIQIRTTHDTVSVVPIETATGEHVDSSTFVIKKIA